MIDEDKEVEIGLDAKEAVDNDEPFFTISEVPPAQAVIVRAELELEPEDDKQGKTNEIQNDTSQGEAEADDEASEREAAEGDQVKEKLKLKKQNDWKAKKISHELEAENVRLKQALDISLKYGQTHYQNNIDIQLEKAIQNRLNALKSGDPEAFAKTELELFEAVQIKREIDNNNRRQESMAVAPQQHNDEPDDAQIMLQQWFVNNPELSRNSPFYDKELANEAITVIRDVDGKLQENGDEDWIGTPQYFNYLQTQVDKVRMNARKNAAVPSKPTYSTKHIGGVRGTPSSGSAVKEAVTLTNDQKEIAALFKISEETYLKRYNAAERQRLGHK